MHLKRSCDSQDGTTEVVHKIQYYIEEYLDNINDICCF